MVELDSIVDPEMREEWEHFRRLGWPDDRIAERLDVNVVAAVTTSPAGHRDRGGVSRSVYLDDVAALHRAGLRTSEIARHLGVRTSTVSRCKKDLGIPIEQRVRSRRPNLETRRRVIELHAAGYTTTGIMAELGLARSNVVQHKIEAGVAKHISMERRAAAAAERRARVAGLHASGMSVQQIATHLGVPLGTVKSDVRRINHSAAHTRVSA